MLWPNEYNVLSHRTPLFSGKISCELSYPGVMMSIALPSMLISWLQYRWVALQALQHPNLGSNENGLGKEMMGRSDRDSHITAKAGICITELSLVVIFAMVGSMKWVDVRLRIR